MKILSMAKFKILSITQLIENIVEFVITLFHGREKV
jgi:hypothetical protein